MLCLFLEGDSATVLDIIAQASWDGKNLDELVEKYDTDASNEKVFFVTVPELNFDVCMIYTPYVYC